MGNNDMYPHNIMYPGPNEVTHEYLSIWKSFVPFPSYQVFQRGAYYSVEVVPNHLAVISLNTLYWYDSNKAVDGCPPKSDDPGREQLDWLQVQLDRYRKRKMQVWIMGHVPPTLGNYYLDCYLGYARLALRYQDTIVGHLFGHMNVDHFFWIDTHELHHPPKPLVERVWSYFFPEVSIERKKRYSLAKTLRSDFRDLPPAKNPEGKKGMKINFDDYVIVNVGPSVVPTFLPSVRVFRYNVTEWNAKVGAPLPAPPDRRPPP
ncbi:Endopolyphosphatase, partial [Tulasnella sp. 403]